MEEVVFENISWRGTAEIIGYVALVENMVLIICSIALLTDPSTYLYFLVTTLLANVCWLYGAIHYKTVYMLISLLWYLVPMIICINYTICSIIKSMNDIKINSKDNDIFAVSILTCFFVGFYILAAVCLASMWRTARWYSG